MYDNDLANYTPPYVRYRSPTEAGNSGSPVFNRQWGLFAVHHRALQVEQVNEGVLFDAISAVAKNRVAGFGGKFKLSSKGTWIECLLDMEA